MHKIVRISVSLAVALLGLIAVVAAQNSTPDNTTPEEDKLSVSASEAPAILGGDEATLRELLARVIYNRPDSQQGPVVYAGALPEKMPFDLPLPDKTRLIGSIVYGGGGDMEILLDVSLLPSDVIDFFRSALAGDRWSFVESYPYAGYGSGFVSELTAVAKFCFDSGEASLTVNSNAAVHADTSQVQIILNRPGNAYTCSLNATLDKPFSLLPQLQTPDGVTLLPGNGSGSGGTGLPGFRSGSISALLHSTLPLHDIANAYNEQLEAAGWEAVDSEMGSHLAWSGWTLNDMDGKAWAGTLTLTANPTVADQYTAQVTIQEIAAP